MTSIAATERTLLSGLAQQLGPDAPTLCEGWSVKDLVVHLIVREGSPAAVGIAVPPLGRWLQRVSDRRGQADFAHLVDALRQGPPLLSPYSLPGVGALLNTVELFVHHEDVRRAQPEWSPRTLPERTEDALWRSLRVAGRGVAARSPVGVRAERSDTGATSRLRRGEDVVLRGLPSELVLYLLGRTGHALVEVEGEPEDVAAFRDAPLGI